MSVASTSDSEWPKDPLGISVYVHFPYCLRKCPYCDFNSYDADRNTIPSARYADAVIAELRARIENLRAERGELPELRSIFFGGGTPSLWNAADVQRVIRSVSEAFPETVRQVEITAECNPTSLSEREAAALAEAGINRMSVGIQSLDNERLKYLGRLHDRDGALAALRVAKKIVPRVSADFMFGLPGLQPNVFLRELDEVLALGIDHISAYALTIEAGTQFGALHKKGRLPIASDDDFADTYLATEAHLVTRGFLHYEVSNYAQLGQASVHNLHYWRGGDYLGVGAGAVGCVTARQERIRWRNVSKPDAYMDRTLRAKAAATLATRPQISPWTEWSEVLGPNDVFNENLMLGLRTQMGVEVATLSSNMKKHVERGALRYEGGRLIAQAHSWLRLDAITADLFQ